MINEIFRSFRPTVKLLSNGLPVILNPIKGDMSCAAVFVKVGSRNENMATSGTSHFLEHMSFKGTSNMSKNDITSEMEKYGSLLNAHTSREYQCYTMHSQVPLFESGVKILGEMLTNSKFAQSDIRGERDTICTELQEVYKTIEEFFFEELHGLCYPDHSLGLPILGTVEDIKQNITRKKLLKFKEEFYTAENMVLCGVGDVEIDEFCEFGEKYFSRIPKISNSSRPGKDIDDSNHSKFCYGARKIIPLGDTGNILNTAICFEGAGFDNFKDLVIQFVFQVFTGMYDAFEKMNYKSNLVNYVIESAPHPLLLRNLFPFLLTYTDRSLFGMVLVTDMSFWDGSKKKFGEVVDGLIKNLWDYEVTEQELERSKNFAKFRSISYYSNDLAEFAEEIGRNHIFFNGDWNLQEFLKIMDEITVEDMNNFFDKYIRNRDPVLLYGGKTVNV